MKDPAEDKINVGKVLLDAPDFLDRFCRQMAANFSILKQLRF
jgi:hypothetical protein